MPNDLEQLPYLLSKAIATLENAKTAAEILEAHMEASVVYDVAARLARIRGAHATVLAACRKAQADALEIEARAQCRLADEYDAAQARGEVAKRGQQDRVRDNVPDGNIISTTEEIGLTRKQIHQARKIRDAEQASPGIVRETVTQQLADGQEPTRAAIKRAITPKSIDMPPRLSKGRESAPVIVALRDAGKATKEIAQEVGFGERYVSVILEREDIARQARIEASIVKEDLSLSAQKKLEALERRLQKDYEIKLMTLEQNFGMRVYKAVQERFAPELEMLREKEATARREIERSRKGGFKFKADIYKLILTCLHPDSRNSTSEKRLNTAFNAFKGAQKYLLSLEDFPEEPPDLIFSSMEEMMAARARRTAENSARSKAAHARKKERLAKERAPHSEASPDHATKREG